MMRRKQPFRFRFLFAIGTFSPLEGKCGFVLPLFVFPGVEVMR
jgi:hypothetical protein